MQACLGIFHNDGGVIDSEEKRIGLLLPAWVAFASGELDELKYMIVWIAEIEGPNACYSKVPSWQCLRCG